MIFFCFNIFILEDDSMVNIIWGVFIIIGIIFGLINGKIDLINNEVITSGKVALDLLLEMIPMLALWMGLMKIAEDSGLLRFIAKKLSFILRFLFPKIPSDNPALGLIASNVAINMAGLGSAATPCGLKAMKELQKINEKKDTASSSMITFLVLNTGGVTIIPTTIISMRAMYGSINPTEVIPTCILATFCSNICGLILDFIIRRKNGNN